MKNTRRSLIASAVSLLLCLTMLLGSTYAWFTDSAVSRGNKIQAGNLDVQLYMHTVEGAREITSSSAPIFGVNAPNVAQNDPANTLWEPGKTQTVYLSIKNNGNLDLKYMVALEVTEVTNDLDKYMEYAIAPDAEYGDDVEWAGGTQVSLGTNATDSNDVALKAGEEHFFALSVHMNEDATNEQMKGTIMFDIKVLAGQLVSELDSTGGDYDKDATYPSVVVENITDTTKSTDIATDGVTVTIPENTSAGVYTLEISNKKVVEENVNTNVSLDISLLRDGEKVEEDGSTVYPVSIKIAEPGDIIYIANVTHNGEEIINYSYDPATGTVFFETSHFSPFSIRFYDLEGAIEVSSTEELAAALVKKNNGSTIVLLEGEYTLPELSQAKVSDFTIIGTKYAKIIGATNSGYKNIAFRNITFNVDIKGSFYGNCLFEHCTFDKAGITSSCYVSDTGTLTVDGCTFNDSPNYAMHFGHASNRNYGTVIVKNSTFNGCYVINPQTLNFSMIGCDFNDAYVCAYGPITITESTFDSECLIYISSNAKVDVTITLDKCIIDGGADVLSICCHLSEEDYTYNQSLVLQFVIDGTVYNFNETPLY